MPAAMCDWLHAPKRLAAAAALSFSALNPSEELMNSCPVCDAPLPDRDQKSGHVVDFTALAARTEIGAEMLRVHRTAYGTGAESARVEILDDLVMVWFNELELSVAERTLIDGGQPDTVLRTRAAFQKAVEPTFTAIVERATGRRVADFISTTSLAPLCSVELFRLHPVGDSAPVVSSPQ